MNFMSTSCKLPHLSREGTGRICCAGFRRCPVLLLRSLRQLSLGSRLPSGRGEVNPEHQFSSCGIGGLGLGWSGLGWPGNSVDLSLAAPTEGTTVGLIQAGFVWATPLTAWVQLAWSLAGVQGQGCSTRVHAESRLVGSSSPQGPVLRPWQRPGVQVETQRPLHRRSYIPVL